jgi:ribonuclease-3
VTRVADDLGLLAMRLGYQFADGRLLERAVTHASWAHENPPAAHNETLAFLGDAVLALVVAEALVDRMPGEGPGPLTQARAEVVSGRSLAAAALRLGLGGHLRLGRGEEQGGGRAKESVLATAFEAVLGALYLDGGLPAARPAILGLMADVVG